MESKATWLLLSHRACCAIAVSKVEELVGGLSAGDRSACWALARWYINRWPIDVALLKSLVPCYWRVTGVLLLGALASRCCFL